MKLNITFRSMETSPSIKDYIKEKISRVKKFVHEPIEVNVVLSKQKYNINCDVSISSDGKFYNGSETSGDVFSSIDKVMDKLQRQLRDSKQRRSRA